MVEMPDELQVIHAGVAHGATHARKTFAEAQIIGRIGLGRLALGPIPVAPVLQVHHLDGERMDRRTTGLQAEVVDAAQTLLKNLWRHDGRADAHEHTSVQVVHRFGEDLEIEPRRPPHHRPVMQGMGGNDIIADARMDRGRDAVPEGLRQDRGFLPGMRHSHKSPSQLVPEQRLQGLRPGWTQRMVRRLLEVFAKRLDGGQMQAVLEDQASDRPAVAFRAQASRQEGQMDIPPGFIPGAKAPLDDIFPDAFGRFPAESELPIVDAARSIGGQMGQPSAGHHRLEDGRRPISQQVGAIHQDHAGLPLAGLEDAPGDGRHGFLRGRSQWGRRLAGFHQDLLDPAQAAALSEREDLHLG